MSAIAYLKTDCEQCDGHIEYPSEFAGHSTNCPHCQHLTTLPAPFTPPPLTPPILPRPLPVDAAQRSEEVFFSEAGVLVSKTLFAVDSQTFALAGITSVRGMETPPKRATPIIFLFICFLFFSVSFNLGLLVLAVLMLFVLAASIVWMCVQKSTFSVVVTTAGGEVKAHSSYDRAFVSRIIDGITIAITARG